MGNPTLDQLALKYGTDKASNHHNYTKYYEQFFEPMRNDRIMLWEAGYGGYHYPDRGGEGARTWREYFPNAIIVSTDIHDKTNVPNGVEFQIGSQDDSLFWNRLLNAYGNPDIIIDDASHINPLSRDMFGITFPMLNSGGYYVVEDIESSWWEEPASDGVNYYGNASPFNMSAPTIINLMRLYINEVNIKHIKGYFPDHPIESMHFFCNMVVIKKK